MKKLVSLFLCFALCFPLTAFASESTVTETNIPVVSVTMDEYGEIQDIATEGNVQAQLTEHEEVDGIEVIDDTEEITDTEVTDDTEEITDIEVIDDIEEITDVEVTGDTEKITDIGVTDDTEEIADVEVTDGTLLEEDVTENISSEISEDTIIDSEDSGAITEDAKAAPLEPPYLTGYYGVKIVSVKDVNNPSPDKRIIEKLSGGESTSMLSYTYRTAKKHYNEKVTVSIRKEGFGVMEHQEANTGKLSYTGHSSYDIIVDPTNNAMLAWTDDVDIINLDPNETQVIFETRITPSQDRMKTIIKKIYY